MKHLFIFSLLLIFFAIACANTDTKKDPSADIHTHTEQAVYTCPMHPDVISDKAGACPICKMDLVLKKTSAPTDTTAEVYTCPMHPDVISDKAGTCPICKMDLVPKKKHTHASHTPSITLSPESEKLAQIKTEVIRMGTLNKTLRLQGVLAADAAERYPITSRAQGRVEKLYVREVGAQVHKGMPLYMLYTEELALLEKEYATLLARKKRFSTDRYFAELAAGAREKLVRREVAPSIINGIEKGTYQISEYTTFYAAHTGVVSEMYVQEGARVREGDALLRVENLQHLVVEAELFASEKMLLATAEKVRVQVEGNPNPMYARIDFIDPDMNLETQKYRMRIAIANPKNLLRVGAHADVFVPLQKSPHIILPSFAIIREEAGAHVWVKKQRGVFAAVPVHVGREQSGSVEILDGLEVGDSVVLRGAYKLYAAYVLQYGASPYEKWMKQNHNI